VRSPASTTTVAVGNAATSRQNGRCQQTRLPWKIAHHSMKSGRRNGGAARADDQLGTPTNDDRRVVGRAGLPCDVIDHPGSVSRNRSTGRQTRTSYHRSGFHPYPAGQQGRRELLVRPVGLHACVRTLYRQKRSAARAQRSGDEPLPQPTTPRQPSYEWIPQWIDDTYSSAELGGSSPWRQAPHG
jgi:hypothetical protein